MTDENGTLSIDFLAGFTIFLLAFIWVVSMIPGLMIGVQSYTIDYDAVAYRTGVILVEDPGYPVSPPWESYIDAQKSNVTRFGLALSKDTPNILSQDKVNRFFCTTFIYPNDYHMRAIFGDYPYAFNISLTDLGGQNRSVGDVLPDGYGTIRRVVKIKGASNSTINNATDIANSYIKADNVTTHVFTILIDNPKLARDVTDPAYQIDPAREQITINITDLRSTITNYPPEITNTNSTISLRNIKVYKRDGGLYSNVPLPASEFPYIDGISTRLPAMPAPVTDNVTLRFSPQFFDLMKAQNSQIYIALGFDVDPPSTFLNNTQALPDYDTLDGKLTFDNPNTTPFNYDYNPKNVTQPYLRDAVLEVAVWSGAVTSYGGGLPNATSLLHTIYATAGGGGTISPPGSVSVNDGANQVFMIKNNSGYHIADILVDGSSVGAVSTYTFSNVTQDHTIAASFATNITASAGTGGTITPNGIVSVNYGASQTFTITNSTGYYIADVLRDGSSVGAVSTYTFNNVIASHTIVASFALLPTVTSISPTSGPAAGGTIVTITGTGFTSAGTVSFGGTAGTGVTFVSDTQITVTSPARVAGGTVDVRVTTAGGTSAASANDRFTYTGVAPTVTSISPTTGPAAGGTAVTITGTGFTSAATVKFGVTAGTGVTFVSDTQITVTSPAHAAGTIDVTVTTVGGTSAASANDRFKYT